MLVVRITFQSYCKSCDITVLPLKQSNLQSEKNKAEPGCPDSAVPDSQNTRDVRELFFVASLRKVEAEELAAFDQFARNRVVRLHVEEKPTFAQDVIHRNNA